MPHVGPTFPLAGCYGILLECQTPRLNSRGDVLLGAAGGPASVNQQPLSIPAGVACWLTDDLVICQRFSPTALATVNGFTGEVLSVYPRACNQLTAGAGRAAGSGWLGVFGSMPSRATRSG